MDNRSLGDIIEPDCSKPKSFDNRVDLTKDNDITVIYGLKFMEIIINGETRYFSKKEKYMRSGLLSEVNKTSFEIKIGADKFADITVKKMTVEEYDADPEPIPVCNEIFPVRLSLSKTKASFEECISLLSPTLQKEIAETDRLLTSEKELKIKRKIEGDQFGCKVTYKSAHGFSYSLCINENLMNHFFWWYMLSNYKFDDKYGGRKNDLTIETLKHVYNQSPKIALRLFGYYDECYGCEKDCCMPTIYEFQGEKVVTCHGKMFMNMNSQTFLDLRVMFDVMKTVIKEFENGF